MHVTTNFWKFMCIKTDISLEGNLKCFLFNLKGDQLSLNVLLIFARTKNFQAHGRTRKSSIQGECYVQLTDDECSD